MENCIHKGPPIQGWTGTCFACALLREQSGFKGKMIPEKRCATCVEVDDGASFVSMMIALTLRQRVAVDWSAPASECRNCSGSTITLDEAIARLKARIGDRASEDVLKAMDFGMPKETADSLAVKHFPELCEQVKA